MKQSTLPLALFILWGVVLQSSVVKGSDLLIKINVEFTDTPDYEASRKWTMQVASDDEHWPSRKHPFGVLQSTPILGPTRKAELQYLFRNIKEGKENTGVVVRLLETEQTEWSTFHFDTIHGCAFRDGGMEGIGINYTLPDGSKTSKRTLEANLIYDDVNVFSSLSCL